MDQQILCLAWQGALQADALAMPVHWYYDRQALRQDYGTIDRFMAPKNPHPDSILWRSSYTPLNQQGDILHQQAQYWGQRGIHYHQFLSAGENTLNFQLGKALIELIEQHGNYDPARWVDRYIEIMLTPDWHRDTYLEEYHRGFFKRYAAGKQPLKCAVRDEHIGGLAQVPALLKALAPLQPELPELTRLVKQHVGLTHAHANVLRAADTLTRILYRLAEGDSLIPTLQREAGDWLSTRKADKWQTQPDTKIIGERFSPACYIDQAMPASLYLCYKYANDPVAGLIANAQVGGDNCHRGAVVGSILAAANPGVPLNFAR